MKASIWTYCFPPGNLITFFYGRKSASLSAMLLLKPVLDLCGVCVCLCARVCVVEGRGAIRKISILALTFQEVKKQLQCVLCLGTE